MGCILFIRAHHPSLYGEENCPQYISSYAYTRNTSPWVCVVKRVCLLLERVVRGKMMCLVFLMCVCGWGGGGEIVT